MNKRNKEIQHLRVMVSGSEDGGKIQQTQELKMLSKEEAQQLLKDVGIHQDIEPRMALSFKSSQNVSWSKLRSYRR